MKVFLVSFILFYSSSIFAFETDPDVYFYNNNSIYGSKCFKEYDFTKKVECIFNYINALYKKDVVYFFDLQQKYPTALQKKLFKKTQEYKDYKSKMQLLKTGIYNKRFCFNVDFNNFSNYNLKTKTINYSYNSWFENYKIKYIRFNNLIKKDNTSYSFKLSETDALIFEKFLGLAKQPTYENHIKTSLCFKFKHLFTKKSKADNRMAINIIKLSGYPKSITRHLIRELPKHDDYISINFTDLIFYETSTSYQEDSTITVLAPFEFKKRNTLYLNKTSSF